jgi:hypothetical protein
VVNLKTCSETALFQQEMAKPLEVGQRMAPQQNQGKEGGMNTLRHA